MPTALITGVSGQDGSYLAEFLLGQGYRVIGTTRDARRALEGPHARALAGIELVVGEIDSPSSAVLDAIRRDRPDEVYHLGAPSKVSASWDDPAATMADIALSTGLLVEAMMEELPSPRLFLAGSCEVFSPEETAQNESAPVGPVSPYGEAKRVAMQFVARAREQYGIYAVTGILFNHESPRRGRDFVSRKIARSAVRIARGEESHLTLGSLDVRRDWGFAGDYVRAMWLMLFQDEPEDLVVGTGVAHSVAEMCDAAFRRVGLHWKDYVTSDPMLVRRSDPPLRLADPTRAKSRLRWTPEVDFERLMAMMVDHEMGEGTRGA